MTENNTTKAVERRSKGGPQEDFAIEKVPENAPATFSLPILKTICEALSQGVPLKHATKTLGMEWRIVTWRKAMPDYIEQALAQAEGKFVSENLKVIRKARDKCWQAAAWLLERRFPDDFSKVGGSAIKGAGDQPMVVNIISAVPRPVTILQGRLKVSSGRIMPGTENLENPPIIEADAEIVEPDAENDSDG